MPAGSALAGFEAGIALVDDVDAALATHDAAVLVALLQRLQGIGDLHDKSSRRTGNLAKARNIGGAAASVNRGQISGRRFTARSPPSSPPRATACSSPPAQTGGRL